MSNSLVTTCSTIKNTSWSFQIQSCKQMSDCSREDGIGREEQRWPLPSLAVLWIVNACERKPNRKKLSIHRELNFTNQIKIAIFVFHSYRLFNNLWYIFTKAEFLDTAVIATHISCEVLALTIWKKNKT